MDRERWSRFRECALTRRYRGRRTANRAECGFGCICQAHPKPTPARQTRHWSLCTWTNGVRMWRQPLRRRSVNALTRRPGRELQLNADAHGTGVLCVASVRRRSDNELPRSAPQSSAARVTCKPDVCTVFSGHSNAWLRRVSKDPGNPGESWHLQRLDVRFSLCNRFNVQTKCLAILRRPSRRRG